MYNNQMMQQMQPTNNNPNYQMDFQNQNDVNMDMVNKLKKRQAMANMLQKQMEAPSAPNAMGGVSGVIGGLALGMGQKQNADDFNAFMKNGAFGAAGTGLSKYL